MSKIALVMMVISVLLKTFEIDARFKIFRFTICIFGCFVLAFWLFYFDQESDLCYGAGFVIFVVF